ncbi:MAG: metal-dependent hydrolase [Candidatus Lokiarchaeota archaeon]|nr:metal-dependent hydrolase [Candidatus Lokiarchaeota archaeon]
MDIFTHSVFGALLYILFLKEVTFEYIFIAIFFSFLPDLDIFLFPLKRIFKSNYLEHRGGSHSYIMGIIISAVLSIVFSTLRNKSFFIAWIIGSVFYGLHVSMDLLTTTKIPYLYPLSKKEHSFYVEKAGSSFTFINSLIFLIILLLMYHNSAGLFLFVGVINFYTYFFLIYYLYRILTKIWINLHLKDNQKYFPGVLPFYFVIFEHEIAHDGISLCIEKKSHFSKSKVIYKNQSILDSEEMVFFKRGIELCNEYYYYAKWTFLPIFIRNNGVFSIRFFFLETMVHGRTNYIQFDFDRFTQQVVDFNRGYGRILA